MPSHIRDIVRNSAEALSELIDQADQRWFEAEVLAGHVLGHDRDWVVLHPEERVSTSQAKTIQRLIARRLKHEPIAYLLGQAPFLDFTFCVNRHTLIPRAESEWLVETARTLIGKAIDWTVWDVGTGSGCLGLSIAKRLSQVSVIASDRSKKALQVAHMNAQKLNVQNVSFLQGSLLAKHIKTALKEQPQHHLLIVANLPYLPESDRTTLQKQVTAYEPSSALFADEDGLALIKRLLKQLRPFLKQRTGDVVLLEHDPRQAKLLLTFAKAVFPKAAVSSELDQNNATRFTKILT